MPLTNAVCERGPAPAVLEVDVRLRFHQSLHDVKIARASGQVQTRTLVVVGGVGLAAAREQKPDLIEVSGLGDLTKRTYGELVWTV